MVRKLLSLTLLMAIGPLLLCVGMNAQNKAPLVFTLASGQYSMKATYKVSDQEDPVVNAGGTVSLSVKDDEIAITIPLRPKPIVAKLSGNTFRGQLQDIGVRVEFSGEIVENNHIEGTFSGGFGERRVNGLWTMKFSKKQQDKSGGS